MNFRNLDVRRLYELWKTGRYQSYPAATLVDLVARILALVPPWTRVYRVQRDIPMPLVTSGVEHGNLRELALARMKDFGTECRDVRTREVGIQEIHNKVGFLRRVLPVIPIPIHRHENMMAPKVPPFSSFDTGRIVPFLLPFDTGISVPFVCLFCWCHTVPL